MHGSSTLFLVATLAASGQAAPQGPVDRQTSPSFQPPSPAADGADWIRLKSGEWLRGTVERMRDESLEFDSDVLENLRIDWDDVAEVRMPRTTQVLLDPQRIEIGRVLIVGDELRLSTDTGETTFPRSLLLALVPGEPTEWNYWSGKVGFGLTTRSGNTSQKDASGHASLLRETADTRLDLTYRGSFSETAGHTTANNHLATGRFDYFLSRRLFLTPLGFEYYRDPFQNIRGRLTPYAGFGYELLDRRAMEWNALLGVSYQRTELDSVPAGESDSRETAALRVGTTYEWDLTGAIELDFSYRADFSLEKFADYNHHLESVLSVDLVGDLDLDITFIWDRVNRPVADSSGSRPRPDDYRTTVGLAWDF